LFPDPEEKWLERDVLPQDWETFVNYLIPSHADVSNYEVANRKLKAELIDERMHRLTLDANDSSRIDLRDVDAQLEPLRQSHTEEGVSTDINAMITAWNEGFFGPRGVFVEASERETEDGTRAMPGSWTNDPTEVTADSQTQVPPCMSRRGFGGGWIRADNSGFHIGKNIISADNNGFRIGKTGLVADSNGFRIGNLLVADGQGFKLGPIRADTNGFRIGGGNPQPNVSRDHYRGYHPEHHTVHMPPIHRGRPSEHEVSSRMPHRERSRSTSSSSSSGASSIESAGSLPDCNHLKDTQLPVAKQAVKDWLNHPDQSITKQTVKRIKEEIKAAKCGHRTFSETERDALRKEVHDLFKEFKAAIRSQKTAWKAGRQERKRLRREARRARRTARREVRNAEREVRNAEQDLKKAARHEIKAGKMREIIPPMPAFPAMPGVPGLHTPPGAWPLEHEYQGFPQPPFYMSPLSPSHSMPHMGPPKDGKGWSFTENPQITSAARATVLQAESRLVEAEAFREPALRKAEETRRRAQIQASAGRTQAEETSQQAERKAATVREKAQATAAIARERAEEERQRAEANASIARQKAEANHMLADANKMHVEVNKMRMQAGQLKDKARLQLLDAAEKLHEDAEKLKREGERLIAEALQSAKDVENAFHRESTG
jgi:hypothetical protein